MAAKVGKQETSKNLDDSLQLGTRNIKIALRKLRKMTRKSENFEFDLDKQLKVQQKMQVI